MGALAESGATLVEGYTDAATQARLAGADYMTALDAASEGLLGTAEAMGQIDEWAAAEHSTNLQWYTMRSSAIDGYELNAQSLFRDMLAESMQDSYVMLSPFVSAAYNADMAREQWEHTKVWNWLSVGFAGVDLLRSIVFSGPRGGHMPEPKSDSGGLFGSLVPAGAGVASTAMIAGAMTPGGWLGAAAAGAAAAGSDRVTKTDIQPLDTSDVLEKLEALPMHKWRYRIEPDQPQHIGPMAQDFYSKFQLGNSDKMITAIDAFGVTLSAIQALTQQVKDLKQQVKTLEQNHGNDLRKT
jgi:hypothetical protein